MAILSEFMKHISKAKIKDSVETTSNPFDNESVFLSTDSRATTRRKRQRRDRYRKGVNKYRSKRIDYENKEGK